jgi:DNA-binding LacI/PurR family transcriptional regulator
VKLVGDREEEELLYRRWASERRVDGVLLTEFDAGDRRLDLLRELELPVAAMSNVLGGDPGRGDSPAVWQDERAAVGTLLDHAFDGGHRRIGWITGPGDKRAVLLREQATLAWAAERGAVVTSVYTDYGPEQGAAAAKRLLAADTPPTLLVFDNDRMALAGLSTCHELGVSVPRDLSVACFVDGELCAISVPPITALHHDIVAFGRSLTRRLLDTLDGRDEPDRLLPPLALQVRASIGPPARR